MLKKKLPSLARRLTALAAIALLPSIGFAISDGTETFSIPDASLLSNGTAGPSGATVTDVNGWDFTVFSASSTTAINFDIWDGAVGSGNGVAFWEPSGLNSVDYNRLLISPTGGFFFDLDSIGLNIQLWNGTQVVNDQMVTLQGLDSDGFAITGATLTLAVNDGLLVDFATSSMAQFDQIAGLQITPDNASLAMSYGFIDDIDVSNVSAIPEPGAAALLAAGFLGIALRRRPLAAAWRPSRPPDPVR